MFQNKLANNEKGHLIHPLSHHSLNLLMVEAQQMADVKNFGTPLVMQWLRICLSMQGTWVRAQVREDPTCLGATKPVHHNY